MYILNVIYLGSNALFKLILLNRRGREYYLRLLGWLFLFYFDHLWPLSMKEYWKSRNIQYGVGIVVNLKFEINGGCYGLELSVKWQLHDYVSFYRVRTYIETIFINSGFNVKTSRMCTRFLSMLYINFRVIWETGLLIKIHQLILAMIHLSWEDWPDICLCKMQYK